MYKEFGFLNREEEQMDLQTDVSGYNLITLNIRLASVY